MWELLALVVLIAFVVVKEAARIGLRWTQTGKGIVTYGQGKESATEGQGGAGMNRSEHTMRGLKIGRKGKDLDHGKSRTNKKSSFTGKTWHVFCYHQITCILPYM